MCVVTGCENEEPTMQTWIVNNIESFKKVKLDFQDMVAVCCAKGGRMEKVYKPLREESEVAVWESIKKYASASPVQFIGSSTDFGKSLKSLWNGFCDFVHLPRLRILHWELHSGLVKMESEDKDASAIAQQFYKVQHQ